MMVKVYLAGPVSSGAEPYDWHDEIRELEPDISWVNPFLLHDYGEEEKWNHIDEIIEQDLSTLRECDAVLLRRIDDYNLCGASIEAREAYVNNIPVVVWNDAETTVPLFLQGHAYRVVDSAPEAIAEVKRVIKEAQADTN